MLRFVFTDIFDNELIADTPVSMTVNMEEGVPADDMTAVFVRFDTDELKDVRILDDDTVVFTGIVDEQQTICNEKGEFIKVVARSMAARLLDNESVPISYTHPCTDVIASRHLIPFGVRVSDDKNTTYFGTQTVLKGATNWQAVEDFSKNAFSTVPRVNEKGELEFETDKKREQVVFSNTGEGIRYLSFTESVKRCEEISSVRIKVTNACGYNSVVENKDAVNRKILRERYLNAVLTDTPAEFADRMIKNGRAKAYSVTLQCVGQCLKIFNNSAVIKDSVCGEIDGLYISSIRYQLSSDKDITTVTLKRKEV